MKRYKLVHRTTGEIKLLDGLSLINACARAGWEVRDTWIREESWAFPDGWKDVTPKIVEVSTQP